jgi:hypothetical protein
LKIKIFTKKEFMTLRCINVLTDVLKKYFKKSEFSKNIIKIKHNLENTNVFIKIRI